MQHLITHARNFQSRIAHRRADFERLAEGQQPHALFVSCSDSRVVPSLITNAVPGEVFELRTAGNIVPRHRPGAACGVGATLEFALEVLEVPNIVVCGHSHCGAIQSIVRGQTARSLPLVRRWLDQAEFRGQTRQLGSDSPESDEIAKAAQQNVLVQLNHLRTYPCVIRRLTARQLRIHGWFYTVHTGEVFAWRPDVGAFRPL